MPIKVIQITKNIAISSIKWNVSPVALATTLTIKIKANKIIPIRRITTSIFSIKIFIPLNNFNSHIVGPPYLTNSFRKKLYKGFTTVFGNPKSSLFSNPKASNQILGIK
jgi:hypothetical protein